MQSPTESANPTWNIAPFWQVARPAEPHALHHDLTCDTVVIGGGVTGLCVAYNLADKQKVVVLESNQIGEGSTGWSAGILSLSTTIDLHRVGTIFGEESARTLVFFLSDAIMKIKNTIGLTGKDWQSGSSLYLSARKQHRSILEHEYEIRHKYGLPTEHLEKAHLSKSWRDFNEGLELQSEHAVHPVRLLLELTSAITKAGGKVYENSPVTSWEHTGNKFVVTCGEHKVEAQNLIVCTGLNSNTWPELSDINGMCIPVSGHVIVTKPSEEIAATMAKKGRIAMWDSLQLYHYVRYLPDGRVLIGGEEAPGPTRAEAISIDDAHAKRLHEWASKHHVLPIPPIQHAWKASLSLPADGLPFMKFRQFGDENIFIGAITDGLPFAFLLGQVITGLLGTNEHPLAQMLSHRRNLPPNTKLLGMLPQTTPLRNVVYQTAFAYLKLRDTLPL